MPALLQNPPPEDPMTRLARTLIALMFGGSLLFAQLPNPLGLPDPLGLSKKPAPAREAPRSPREGRRAEREPRREARHDNGKHKGQQKRQDRERDERKGHDKH
jgi:hypothetical protein